MKVGSPEKQADPGEHIREEMRPLPERGPKNGQGVEERPRLIDPDTSLSESVKSQAEGRENHDAESDPVATVPGQGEALGHGQRGGG